MHRGEPPSRPFEEAKRDLDAIWEWVARNGSLAAATRLVDAITDVFLTLWKFPNIGRTSNAFGPETRSFPIHGFIVYYRRRRGGLQISHVIHGRRIHRRAWKKDV